MRTSGWLVATGLGLVLCFGGVVRLSTSRPGFSLHDLIFVIFLLPAPVLVAVAGARVATGALAARRKRERAVEPRVAAQDELHTLLVVIPANADPPVTTAALLKWLSTTLTAPVQLHYARSPLAVEVDQQKLVRDTVVTAVASRTPEVPTVPYRASAASPSTTPAVDGARVLALCVATPATGTTTAAPTTLDDARALLRALAPHTETAPFALRTVPESDDDGLDPARVAELFPELQPLLV